MTSRNLRHYWPPTLPHRHAFYYRDLSHIIIDPLPLRPNVIYGRPLIQILTMLRKKTIFHENEDSLLGAANFKMTRSFLYETWIFSFFIFGPWYSSSLKLAYPPPPFYCTTLKTYKIKFRILNFFLSFDNFSSFFANLAYLYIRFKHSTKCTILLNYAHFYKLLRTFRNFAPF